MLKAISCLFFFTSFIFASDPKGLGIQLDILPYVFNGYSVKATSHFGEGQKWKAGLEVFAMEYPDIYFSDANSDWKGQIDFAVDVTLEKNVWPNARTYGGLFLGPVLGYLSTQFENSPEKVDYQVLEGGLIVSYQWFPFESSYFYLSPYAIMGYSDVVSGKTGTFEHQKALAVVSMFVGYLF